MQLIFGNPYGFWALLALPAIVLIHCFQRKSQPVWISTLFLIKENKKEANAGRRFEFIRQSPSFWFQILAALLLTWLLLQPRWIKEDSVQKVIVLIDDSFSMQAFKAEAIQTLLDQAETITQVAERTEWHIIPTSDPARVLYNGASIDALEGALQDWQPSQGTHEWTDAIRTARSISKTSDRILIITDTPQEAPLGTELYSVGKPIENAGFVGLQISWREGQWIWQTIVRNYSANPITRQWWFEQAGNRSAAQTIQLSAQGTYTLQGAFPADQDAVEIVLQEDAFTLDNRLPMVLPKPKTLQLSMEGTSEFIEWIQPLAESVPHSTIAEPQNADVDFTQSSAYTAPPASKIKIHFHQETSKTDRPLAGGSYVQEDHLLNESLSWNSLIFRTPSQLIEHTALDAVLLWHKNVPLIFLRPHEEQKNLVFNFDVLTSNINRLPAFIILINRFLETVREDKVMAYRANFELNQAIPISHKSSFSSQPNLVIQQAPTPELSNATPLPLNAHRAPKQLGFFKIAHGDHTVVEGATHFAETREADFANCDRSEPINTKQRELELAFSEADFFSPLWLILLVGCLLLNWYYVGKGR